MHMFGHGNVAVNAQAVTLTSFLERVEKQVAQGRVEHSHSTIATEGDEVRLARFVEALEASRHGERLALGL